MFRWIKGISAPVIEKVDANVVVGAVITKSPSIISFFGGRLHDSASEMIGADPVTNRIVSESMGSPEEAGSYAIAVVDRETDKIGKIIPKKLRNPPFLIFLSFYATALVIIHHRRKADHHRNLAETSDDLERPYHIAWAKKHESAKELVEKINLHNKG